MLGVSQEDGPLLSDAVAVVELHQLVQRGEELVPHVVLTTAVLQHLEMLDVVSITAKETKKRGFSINESVLPRKVSPCNNIVH